MDNDEKLQIKLNELKNHYISYRRLIDAGLVIATTSFIDYLEAIKFERKFNSEDWQIMITSKKDKWEL